MRRPGALALAALALLAVWLAGGRPAGSEQIILALSTETVRITSNFTGTGISVFGAIEPDAATVSRGSVYDVVVVMRGPGETLVTRRKERFLGIWLNRHSRTFSDMPSFYSISSSRPLAQVATPVQLQRLQLGPENLDFGPGSDAPDTLAFREAFTRLQKDAGLYREAPYGVTFPGSTVFQASIDVPANVPVGLYRVEVYLFRDNALLATSNGSISISKSGFEQFTFELSRQNGFVYGIACVILALFTGWLAGVLFRKD